LPEGTNTFIHELAEQVQEQVKVMEQVSATIALVRGFDPLALAEKLTALRDHVDGIAVMAVDHPIVREAVRELLSAGTAVVTIGSDIRSIDHLGYVGIDDLQAGRLAGYLIGRLASGRAAKVAFFAGSISYRGHQEREMGFHQILREEFKNLDVVEHREVQDSRTMAEIEMKDILKRHSDIAAVYNAGGGTAGIAAVIERSGRANDINFVAHDLTDGNKSLLLRGTLDAVIDQNARLAVRETLSTLVHKVLGIQYRMVPPRVQVVFRENLPSD
jgi:LacI family transcriptional regulator